MAEILLIAPDRDRADGLRSLLREDGHRVHWERNARDWREAERSAVPELVVAAVPAWDDLASHRGRSARGFPAPLLFVHGEAEFGRDLHLEERLVDRLESPFMSEELLARVDALVRVRRVILRAAVDERPARDADDATRAGPLRAIGARFAAVLGTRVPRYVKPIGPYLEVAARVAEWADSRDGFEPGHAERVATFCGLIADGLRLPEGETSALLRAAMLHDIGKVALPVEVLRHDGPLESEQMRLVRQHPQRGAALLRALDTDDDVAETVLYHHEHVDGSGYYGKKRADMPRTSRILAVAENFDGMTRSRVRPPISPESALAVLERGRGSRFDGECVDALAEALRPRQPSIPISW